MEAEDIMARMMSSIYHLIHKHLLCNGKSKLVCHLWAYVAFKV